MTSSAESIQVFGRYRLLERIARGGMAEVFLAAMSGEEGFEKRVVIKRILPQFGNNQDFVRMFIDEAVLAAQINHPNVVQVYDFGSEQGVFFMALEFVDGVNLRLAFDCARLGVISLSPAQVAAMGEGIARGLSCAHNLTGRRGQPLRIVHRDVSPHNIMLSRSGVIKVMDFGIAKAEARLTRTATGLIKGKMAYMAPEQASDRGVDRRSDQFAVGLVLWEALAGEPMYSGQGPELLRQVVSGEIRPLSHVAPDVPEPLDRVVMRCLDKDPNERFSDLAEVARELSVFRYGLGEAGAATLGNIADGVNARGRPSWHPPARQTWSLSSDDATTTVPVVAPPEETDVASPPERMVLSPPPVPIRRSQTRHVRLVARLWVLLCLVVALGLIWWSRRNLASPPAPPGIQPVWHVLLESSPPGARIRLGGLEVGLETPAVVPCPANPGETLAVGLDRSGFASWEQSLRVEKDQQVFHVVLTPPAAAGPPIPVAPAAAGAKATAARGRRLRKHRSRAGPGKGSAPAMGVLYLRSTGAWVEVFSGHRSLGVTPLSAVSLPAGRVRLRLVNRAAHIDRHVTLDIKPNTETRRTITP